MLHGWGANAQDVAALSPFLHLPDTQLLCPNAPFLHDYSAQGRAWYDLPATYQFGQPPDPAIQAQLHQSRTQLRDWLHKLPTQTGVPLTHTILAGFSQGGAMTLDVGLSLPLAGLMVLSGYLHPPSDEPTLELTQRPVLLVHGLQDSVVPLAAAHACRATLTQLGLPVSYHELTMRHEITPQVLDIMQNFTEKLGYSSENTL
jgi:phospholipase/carboxylesterase